MKWIVTAAGMFLSIQSAQAAQCRDVFVIARPVTLEIQKPFLYSVTKDRKTSFLFGTFHSSVSAQALPLLVTKAITRVQFYLREFDSEKEVETGRFQNSATRDVEPALAYMQFIENSQLAAFGSPEPAALRSPQPELIPMEVELQKYARYRNRSILFLDHVDEVVQAYIDGVNPELLAWTKKNASRLGPLITHSLRAQRAAYVAGNLVEFQREFEQSHALLREEALLRTLVQDRNELWIETLKKKHFGGGFFFAVGAGHLAGEGGLIELLDAEGYIIRRVSDVADFEPPVVESLESRLRAEADARENRLNGGRNRSRQRH